MLGLRDLSASGALPTRRSARRRTVVLVAVGMLMGAPAGAVGADRALASGVSCGTTIAADTKLHSDLVGCPAAGIVIGADGITLDLNGHTIAGSLSGAAGIDNSAGHDRVTIKNGAVRNFTNGVLLQANATGDVVRGLTLVSDNSTGAADNGVLIFDGDHNEIEHNSISGSLNGIFLGDTTDSTVDGNRVSGVTEGIFLFRADRNALKRNAVADVLDVGVDFLGGAENVLERNTIVRTQSGAFLLGSFTDDQTGVTLYPTGNVITRNTMAANLFGVALFEANGNQVIRNSVTDAGTNGDPNHTNAAGLGLVIDGGSRNLLARNTITHGRGVGIQIGAEPNQQPSSIAPSDNTVAQNEITRNASDGIRVVDVAHNTTVKGNLAAANTADGIHVLSATTTLTRNLAVRNGNLGIEAVPHVTDDGGNHAFANANPLQCSSNIAC
jgi:parallel beta-helix repeat protein